MNRRSAYIPALKTNWLTIFLVVYGIFVFLPFLAPVLMEWNLPGPGKAIYSIYRFVCHQLPQRSLFFFGPERMYALDEIQATWQATDNPLILREYIGNQELGWKVAWSDRMISMYGGVWLAGMCWAILGKRRPQLPAWLCLALLLPMVVDGGTHFFSDLNGMTSGFRYSNHWLAALTQNSFPVSFYIGDGIGSFNSWMRWLTGLWFGFGIVWWVFPYITRPVLQGNPRINI